MLKPENTKLRSWWIFAIKRTVHGRYLEYRISPGLGDTGNDHANINMGWTPPYRKHWYDIWYAIMRIIGGQTVSEILSDILITPVSRLLPAAEGRKFRNWPKISSVRMNYMISFSTISSGTVSPTEKINDSRCHFKMHSADEIQKMAESFIKRFSIISSKQSCLPDGPKVGFGFISYEDWHGDASFRNMDRLAWPINRFFIHELHRLV